MLCNYCATISRFLVSGRYFGGLDLSKKMRIEIQRGVMGGLHISEGGLWGVNAGFCVFEEGVFF